MKSFGKKVVLSCKLTKNEISAKWQKNGFEVWQQSGKYFPSTIEEENLATLEIYNFDERDVGEYILLLPNGEHSAPAHVSLEVSPKLELSKEIRDRDEVIVYAGKDLHFEVN